MPAKPRLRHHMHPLALRCLIMMALISAATISLAESGPLPDPFELADAFEFADADQDGSLTRGEWRAFVERLPARPPMEPDVLFTRLDTDHTDCLSLAEFVAGAPPHPLLPEGRP